MKEKIVIVGAGHLAKEVIDFINRYELFDVLGFTVNKDRIEYSGYLGLPIFPIEELENYVDKEKVKLFLAISWYHNMMGLREEKYNEFKNKGFSFANVISPKATIWTEDIGEGNWILDSVYIGYNAKIGNNNVIRAGSSIEHYSSVGNNCFIASNANFAGHVVLGNRCFVGVSSTVYNQVIIGNKCIIGGGVVIKRNIPDYSLCIIDNSIVIQKDIDSIEKYISVNRLKSNKFL